MYLPSVDENIMLYVCCLKLHLFIPRGKFTLEGDHCLHSKIAMFTQQSKDNYATYTISLLISLSGNSWCSVMLKHSKYNSQYEQYSCFILFIALMSNFHVNSTDNISVLGHSKFFKI